MVDAKMIEGGRLPSSAGGPGPCPPRPVGLPHTRRVTEQDEDRVLWRGEPDRYFFIERSDWLVAAIGVVWIAVNVWLILDYLDDSTTALLSVLRIEWRIVALAVGAMLTLGHPLVRGLSLLQTKYTITDRSVIIVVGGIRPSMYALTFDMLLPPVVRHHGDGVGSIAFGEFPRPLDTVAAVVGRRGTSSMIVLRYVWPLDELLEMIKAGRDRAWPAAQRAE
jgi:hypothetical protein